MKSRMESLIEQIKQEFEASSDKFEFLNEIRTTLWNLSPNHSQPVDFVRWVPVDKVKPNDYNPNSVAKKEMQLLYKSVWNDGYTQPVVTIYDKNKDEYVIVDGFHRYFTCRNNADVRERNHGMLPIVVIDKDINDRMASTVRHNRARGKHSVDGMSNMVFEMLDNGWSDAEICNELGMEPTELIKLKFVTGFAKLFEDAEYKKAWESKTQLRARAEYYKQHPEEKHGND